MGKPKGGVRPNSGRKPLAIEENVKAVIQMALGKSGDDTMVKIWEVIIAKARQGSDKHAQILLNYYHGKPKDNLEQPTEMIINVVRKH